MVRAVCEGSERSGLSIFKTPTTATSTPTIFLSAASDDLRDWRDVLHKAFEGAGCHVFTQGPTLGVPTASHGLGVVTTRYSLPDLKAFWQTTAPEVKLLRLSREAGVHLLNLKTAMGTTDSTDSTEVVTRSARTQRVRRERRPRTNPKSSPSA